MPRPHLSFSLIALAASCALLHGCTTVGPDYQAPADQHSAAFARAAEAHINTNAPLADWWTTFGDDRLNDLVARALKANPDIDAARARLRRARIAVDLEQANRMPTAGVSAMTARVRLPDMQFGETAIDSQWMGMYSLGANASWEADLYGSHKRTVEATSASAQVSQAQLADVQLSLSAQVAQAYVGLRTAQNRLRLSQNALVRQERMLALTRQRFERGTTSKLDVTRLTNQIDMTRAEMAPIESDIASYQNALAVLIGQAPGSIDAELQDARDIPLPPAQVPIGDPASMLQRRPDIRAAERTLAARTAQIGVAEAAKFPQLKFTGMLGLGGSEISDLTHLGNITLALLPQLSWNFLDFGRNQARVDQANADRDEAIAQYHGKVLAALKDAEDALARYGKRRVAVAAYARAKASADEAAALTAQRQRAGTVSTIDLLDAERQQILAEQNLVTSLSGLTSDYITLQKALGLGWSDARAPQ